MPRSRRDHLVTHVLNVGELLTLSDVEGRPWTALAHTDGHVELHPPGGAAPIVVDDATAAALGDFLTGSVVVAPELAARARDVLGGLVLDQVHLRSGAYAHGRTIQELAVRRRTGVTIVAVLRGSLPLVGPNPNTALASHDDVVVIGRADAIGPLDTYLNGGP